jgi:hypothetical protein
VPITAPATCHYLAPPLPQADKDQFKLREPTFYNFINKSGCYDLQSLDDRKEFEKLRMAMTVLNIEDEYQEGIIALVSVGERGGSGGGGCVRACEGDVGLSYACMLCACLHASFTRACSRVTHTQGWCADPVEKALSPLLSLKRCTAALSC